MDTAERIAKEKELSSKERRSYLEKSHRYSYYLDKYSSRKFETKKVTEELNQDNFLDQIEKAEIFHRAAKILEKSFSFSFMYANDLSKTLVNLLASDLISEKTKVALLVDARHKTLTNIMMAGGFEKVMSSLLFSEHEKNNILFNIDILRKPNTVEFAEFIAALPVFKTISEVKEVLKIEEI